MVRNRHGMSVFKIRNGAFFIDSPFGCFSDMVRSSSSIVSTRNYTVNLSFHRLNTYMIGLANKTTMEFFIG